MILRLGVPESADLILRVHVLAVHVFMRMSSESCKIVRAPPRNPLSARSAGMVGLITAVHCCTLSGHTSTYPAATA